MVCTASRKDPEEDERRRLHATQESAWNRCYERAAHASSRHTGSMVKHPACMRWLGAASGSRARWVGGFREQRRSVEVSDAKLVMRARVERGRAEGTIGVCVLRVGRGVWVECM